MLVKRRSPRQETSIHPTKTALIATVVSMLDAMSVEEITCDAVLAASGISRGSLYYHFSDFSDLVEHALAVCFRSAADVSIAAMATAVNQSGSREDFRDRLLEVAHSIGATIPSADHLERAVPFAAAASSERFRVTLSAEQQRLTDAYTDAISAAQERGWVSREVHARTVAVLIQAVGLGRVVDAVSPNPMDIVEWDRLIRRVVDSAITND